nr:UDP-GlcNAc:betaGal beta-1,3-N-acetylglucosaminyltransferase-like protein 1 isoform X1 [Leptinotarsa decemlineata]
MTGKSPLISIIIPIFNGANWIKRCFDSILSQSAIGILDLEICVCNDSSTDNTYALLKHWQETFEQVGIPLRIFNNCTLPGGVGFAKNKAISLSRGEFLCFQDIDDVMLPDRILKQYNRACHSPKDMIIGCRFTREPSDSTIRYTKWANSLSQSQLDLQVFTSNGPTVIMPTWFLHRSVYERVDGFVESTKGIPEDLIFFNKHLDLGGKVCRVDEYLLIYTFHLNQTTFSIHESTIWNLRVERLERVVLKNWQQFTIWNAGKQGRKLFNSLRVENKKKVTAMCDVDKNKIGHKYKPYYPDDKIAGPELNIVHYGDALPPFVICVKMDLTGGVFEKNLKELNLKEGVEYIMFS